MKVLRFIGKLMGSIDSRYGWHNDVQVIELIVYLIKSMRDLRDTSSMFKN
jgi:hypothetical protein